jgi:hypothetical protein
MLRSHTHARALIAGFVALVLAATVFAGGVAVGSAGGAQSNDVEPMASAESVPLPSWFIPIWDSYGRNPEITPWFDFASLYSGRPDTGAIRASAALPHGAAVATGPQGRLATTTLPHGAWVATGPQGPLPVADLGR